MKPHNLPAMTVLLVFVSACASFDANEISGTVTHVRDADTIEVGGVPVRLDGVDAPELSTRNGREGKAWMKRNYGGRIVSCVLTGAQTYDRWVGTCYGPGGENISAAVIASGLARDCPRYSGGRYQQFETARSRSLPMQSYCR